MKWFINSVLTLSIVVIIAIGLAPHSINFPFLILLPISVFVFISVFSHKIKFYENSIVLALLLIQITFRYLFFPLLMLKGIELNILGTLMYRGDAVILMIGELLVVFLVLSFNASKYRSAIKKSDKGIEIIPPSTILTFFLIGSLAYVYVSGYFSRVNYIWELSSFRENEHEFEEVSSLAAVLFYPIRMLISLFAVSYIYLKKFKTSKTALYILVILLLNSIIIVGSSRFSIVLSSLPLVTIIYLLFDKIRKPLVVSFSLMTLVVIAISTINKFASSFEGDREIINANVINAYFSGPGNQSQGLELYNSRSEWNSSKFLFSDLFQNVPLLSKYTDDNYKTNVYFNEAIYGHRLYQDQIVPLSLNGLIHFGFLGPFIYVILFLSISLYYERKFLMTSSIAYKLVFVTIAISSSLIFMNNIGSLVASVFRNLLFLGVPVYFIVKLVDIKRIRK